MEGMLKGMQAVAAPVKLGETIEVIERQQAEISSMVNEIRIRLTDRPSTQGNEPGLAITGYLNRLESIREGYRDTLLMRENILEIL